MADPHSTPTPETDALPPCNGCGKPLLLENAWMYDGCPCNSPNGINDDNPRRWKLLWALQQKGARRIEELERERDAARAALVDMDIIGRRENKDPSRREWWSGGTWLYRNQVVAVVELAAAPQAEGGSK